ncbi:MAG: hypothetical protein O7D31_10270, partial [Alphaproteobacteria bacterium]|nr:hypothetical protein [Alphaproteobacteria bacterium]
TLEVDTVPILVDSFTDAYFPSPDLHDDITYRPFTLQMSAYGYKRTFTHTVIYVRFHPESRHLGWGRCMSANDPKRQSREC